MTIRPLAAHDLTTAPDWMREHGILPDRWRDEFTRTLIASDAGGETIGVGMMWTAQVHPGRFSATVIVAPDRRRCGVGSALVTALANAQPERRPFIWGAAESDRAHAFVATFTTRTIQRSPLNQFVTKRAGALRSDGRVRSAREVPRNSLEQAWAAMYEWTHADWHPVGLDAARVLHAEFWHGLDVEATSIALDSSGRIGALIAVYRDADETIIAGEATMRNTPDGPELVAGCMRRALDELARDGVHAVVVDGHETDPHLMPVCDALGPVTSWHRILEVTV